MAGKAASLLILTVIALALGTGCTAPGGGGGTPVPTASPTPVETPVTTLPPTPVVTIPPGPVVTTPPNYDVIVQVMKSPNTAFPYITVAFRGGSGQFILARLTVTVARSDGQVVQKIVPETGRDQYAVGDSVKILGTDGIDRVVVVATILGVDYKIYDQNLDTNTFQ